MNAAAQLPFIFPVRVYWEDTDAGGVVYHAGYVCFLERARTEWLRSFGVAQARTRAERDLVFAIRSLQVDFRAPARLDDELRVTVEQVEVGRASLRFRQSILRMDEGRPTRLASAEVKAACLVASTFRPCGLPADLRDRLLAQGATLANGENIGNASANAVAC